MIPAHFPLCAALLLLPVSIVACQQPLSPEDKITALEAQKRQERADLVRAEGECRAAATEFGAGDVATTSCRETLAMQQRLTAETIADIDARIDQIRRAGR